MSSGGSALTPILDYELLRVRAAGIGPSRHFAAAQQLVALGAKQTWTESANGALARG
jgi:hypothetical protein